jgi:uncharacterized protein (TIGR03083 family)
MTDTVLAAESYDTRAYLEAWEGTLQTVAELGRRLSPEQWEAPTECPGWSAGDVVRHLAWIESFLAGRPQPEHTIEDWSAFPHVTNDFSRITELGVDMRRHLSQAEACDELAGVVDVRLAQLMALDPLTLETEVMGVFGKPVPLRDLLGVRTFDSWTHEQDIRRATGLPANLATPGAHVSALRITAALGFVLAKGLGAAPGSVLRVQVTGPVAFVRTVTVGEDGRGAPAAPDDEPTVTLATDWETYARLAAGRLDTTDPHVRATVTLTGDADLAAQLLPALSITP